MFCPSKIRVAALLITIFAVAAICAAQQVVSEVPAAKTADAATPQFQTRNNRYKIAPGDAFDLNFELSPEFNQTNIAVQPDGFVTLRGIGDIRVQGETVPELTQTLQAAYSKILNDPLISVILKDFEKPYFVADGQIGRPGKYDLRGDITLTQAIAIAGGFKDSSRHSQVLLFRRVSDQWMEAKVINVKKMEKSGSLKEDPMLHPGDMLFVPKNTMSKVDKFFPSASMGTFFRPY
ncbi:MAG TPA: polysaccharide biosynthesis/export family protein [Candidatus Sulfotelmatobacter sp.]